ncbi:NlpC/P60 family protein [Kitasatospora sp. NPDC005856]|uniref:C40 family peptidase n=1 Tax=Kitasatospora sp. NPDC005856 TaxID=3154566 RepID=UPI0033FB7E32
MAAGQVPVPDRSVSLGPVTVSGPRPDAAGDGVRTSANGIDSPPPLRTTADEPSHATYRTAGAAAERARGRVKRKAVPLGLALLCAVLVGAGVHQAVGGSATGPVPAAASGAPALSPDEEHAPGKEPGPQTPTEPQTPTGPDVPTGAQPAPSTPAAPAPATREAVLKRGDTLWGLARDHHTTVQTLQELNGLGDSTLIHAGATLRLPGAVGDSPASGTVTDASGGAVPARFSTGSDIRSASAGDPPGQPFVIGTPSGAGVTPEAEPGALGIRELPEEERSSSTKSGARSKKNQRRDAKGGKAKDSGTDAGTGAAAAVAFARAQIGKPYAWGATGPGSFDCSGLVMRAWQVGGVALPRTTWGMAKAGTATTRGALVPGDLVITNGGGHVQLYIGDGKVVHAPGTGKHVTIAPLAPASRVLTYRHLAS